MNKIKLQKHGSFLELDQDGNVIPIDTSLALQDGWDDLVAKTIQFYKSQLEDNLHSVYIRGSVAKAQAVNHVSDLDSFAIVHEPSEIDFDDVSFHEEMQILFPFCDHLELVAISLDKIKEIPPKRSRSIWEELIKTQSRCVYGEDLAFQIASFQLKDMHGHSLYIENEVDNKLPNYLEEDKDVPEDIKADCSWIMRRLIRGAYDLVMEKEKKFTRDLYLCYEVVSKYYPHKKEQLKEALDLSLNPTVDYETWMVLVMDLKEFIVQEMNS